MPERFRYLAKEVPSPPVRWPWLVGQSHFSLSLFLHLLIKGNTGREKINDFFFLFLIFSSRIIELLGFNFKNNYEEWC